MAAAGIIALLMGAGVAAAIVIISKHHRHVAPQPRSAVAAAGAQTAAGVAPAHPTATTSQATRAGATGNPLAGSTRQGTPRGATGQRNSPPATGAPTVAHGQPLQTPRSQRLVQQLEIAIIDDAAQKAKQRSAAASTTCTPAVGSTAKNASTTTYNCTAFVHANSSDSGNRYRYTGTVDLRSGKASWHFVGAE
jgi:hypothetical protein